MSFTLDLHQFQSTLDPQANAVQAEGLDLVEEAIDDVINQIEEQMLHLQPAAFESAGTIRAASFGGADSAPNLALHYSRAHEVTWKTLQGLKEDLLAFQEACRTAKHEIVVADEDAAQRNNRTREAVDILEVGASNHQGRRDHDDARQDQDTTGGSDV